MPVEVPTFDTHQQAIDWFIAMQHAKKLPPIDFSKLRQGVVDPVTWSGTMEGTWKTPMDLQADITAQLGGRGKLED